MKPSPQNLQYHLHVGEFVCLYPEIALEAFRVYRYRIRNKLSLHAGIAQHVLGLLKRFPSEDAYMKADSAIDVFKQSDSATTPLNALTACQKHQVGYFWIKVTRAIVCAEGRFPVERITTRDVLALFFDYIARKDVDDLL
jgi:hypothetical protein